MKNLVFTKIENYTQNKDNVYILPSKNGFRFLGINFFLFLISMTYANNMALLITFSMSVFFILQMFTTHRIINSVTLKQLETQDQFANQDQYCFCHFQKFIPEELKKFIQLELLTTKKNISGQFSKSYEGHHQFKLINPGRGLYPIKRIKFFTHGPGKLFYVWRFFNTDNKLVIYPERLPVNLNNFTHAKTNNLVTNESEFSHHLRYQQGLSINRIDWKVFAKTDVLYWKKFIDYDSTIYAIDYNVFDNIDKELRLKHMSFLIDKLHIENRPYKLIMPSIVLPVAKGRKQFEHSMEAISDY